MNCPDLNNTFETFVKISPHDPLQLLRQKVKPLIEKLTQAEKIRWYCFLIHDRNSGVPTTAGDTSLYWHLRFEPASKIGADEFLESFPPGFVMTRKIPTGILEEIGGIQKDLLKEKKIVEAWRIIGEQSEWVLRMLDIHTQTAEGAPLTRQIGQFLHYFANMTQLQVR